MKCPVKSKLKIILKVTKNQSYILSRKPNSRKATGGQLDPLSF